jgi:hypothetical protein
MKNIFWGIVLIMLCKQVYCQNLDRKFGIAYTPNIIKYNKDYHLVYLSLNLNYSIKQKGLIDVGFSYLRENKEPTFGYSELYFKKKAVLIRTDLGYKMFLFGKKRGIYYKPSIFINFFTGKYNSYNKLENFEYVYEAVLYPYFGIGQAVGMQYKIKKRFFIDYSIGFSTTKIVDFKDYILIKKWIISPYLSLGYGLNF